MPLDIEILENEGENFLLPKEFVRKCIDAVSDPRKINVARMQDFPIKHLNVVDPLKDNNNLGRSVTSGTCPLFLAGPLFGPSLRELGVH